MARGSTLVYTITIVLVLIVMVELFVSYADSGGGGQQTLPLSEKIKREDNKILTLISPPPSQNPGFCPLYRLVMLQWLHDKFHKGGRPITLEPVLTKRHMQARSQD